MIEHREDRAVARWVRVRRPTLARTLCRRWVDVIRLAGENRPTTCVVCARREAKT